MNMYGETSKSMSEVRPITNGELGTTKMQKLTFKTIFRAYFVTGLILGLLIDSRFADSSIARTIAETFPLIDYISKHSVDPDSWLSYFSFMLCLQIPFMVPIAPTFWREANP